MSKQQDRRRRIADASSRRSFLSGAGAGAGALALVACAGQSRAEPGPTKPEPAGEEEGEEEVSASEDLMREHGALDRLLLIYEESRSRLAGGGGGYRADVLHSAADLVRRFIEQYHEKLEETYLFPRFEKAGQLVDLVHVLATQHVAGRRATAIVLAQTRAAEAPDKAALTGAIDAFVRMYRPHSAREDTVLFPALRRIVSPRELAELGEQFEEVEHQRFGAGGFEAVVAQIAELERTLGIHALAQFTPKI